MDQRIKTASPPPGRATTVLGRSESDVARHILTERLSEMRGEKFEDGQRS
jgi:hypothetical protein